MEKKRGGYRAGAKRPKKFGELKTEYINVLIPTDFKSEIKIKINEHLKKYTQMKKIKYFEVNLLLDNDFVNGLINEEADIEEYIVNFIEKDRFNDFKTKLSTILNALKTTGLPFGELLMGKLLIKKKYADKLSSFDVINSNYFASNGSSFGDELLILFGEAGMEARFVVFNKNYYSPTDTPIINLFMSADGGDNYFIYDLMTGNKNKK